MKENKYSETIYIDVIDVIKSLFLFPKQLNILAYHGFVVLYTPVALSFLRLSAIRSGLKPAKATIFYFFSGIDRKGMKMGQEQLNIVFLDLKHLLIFCLYSTDIGMSLSTNQFFSQNCSKRLCRIGRDRHPIFSSIRTLSQGQIQKSSSFVLCYCKFATRSLSKAKKI